jgi:hypothetical protein
MFVMVGMRNAKERLVMGAEENVNDKVTEKIVVLSENSVVMIFSGFEGLSERSIELLKLAPMNKVRDEAS